MSSRAPRRRPSQYPRSLFASATFHALIVGVGLVWGLLASGVDRVPRREFTTTFVSPPEEQPEPRETPSESVVEPAPPELEEARVQSSEPWVAEERFPLLEDPPPVPDAAPVVLDWTPEHPLLRGVPGSLTCPLSPEPSARVAPEPLAGPPAAPRVVDPVPLEVPPPSYPRLSQRAEEEGTVLCRLDLDPEGRVTAVEVLASSGFTRLDQAAREALARWRFEPRREDGRAVAGSVLHRVTFRLTRG